MDIALSPDGTLAYLTEPASDSLLVLSTATGQLRATIPVGDDPSGLALSPDGAQVWVVNTALSSSTGTVSVVSTATDDVVGTVPVGPGPIDVAFSPDGRTAYVTDNGVISPRFGDCHRHRHPGRGGHPDPHDRRRPRPRRERTPPVWR